MAEKQRNDSQAAQPSGLTPNRVFFFTSASGDFSDELRVLDVTSAVSMSTFAGSVTEKFSKHVETLSKEREFDSSLVAFDLRRKALSSTMKFHDARQGGQVVAELDMAILKHFGAWSIRFPGQSPHSAHDVEIRPDGILQSNEHFIKDSVTYNWTVSSLAKTGALHTVLDGRKVPVAEFVAKRWLKNCGVLVLNTELLDEVVTLATCVAVINR